MFCPKCGSVLVPKKDRDKKKLVCSCGYSNSDLSSLRISERVQKASAMEVVEDDKSMDTMPSTDAECPKCKHARAFYWLVQTRASDEPQTKFLRCEKCKHTWRDYS